MVAESTRPEGELLFPSRDTLGGSGALGKIEVLDAERKVSPPEPSSVVGVKKSQQMIYQF